MAAVAQMDRDEACLATCGARSTPCGVALYVEPPIRVRPTPPAAGSSSQLAASAKSLLTDAAQQQTVHMHISDVTPVRHAQGTLPILRACVACAAAVQTAVLVLFGPSCLGHCRPLQRHSALDKCSVPCRPIKQRQNVP